MNDKEDLIKLMYEYRPYKNIKVEPYNGKYKIGEHYYLIKDNKIIPIEIIFTDKHNVSYSPDMFDRVYYRELNWDMKTTDVIDTEKDNLIFKNQDDAKAKLYETYCEKFTNTEKFNLKNYLFNEEEIIWVIKNKNVKKRIMKKNEKYNGIGFFFKQHAIDYMNKEIDDIKMNLWKNKEKEE